MADGDSVACMETASRKKRLWTMMDTRSRITIAIVDDDRLVREAFKDCMESADYVVREFASAEAFLSSDSGRSADCLILDVRLPNMNGLELQRKLTELGGAPPVVFVTAHGEEETREEAVRQGAMGFLKKPVNRKTLLESIRNALQSRRVE
jgi:FixJ family two-component response regulator